MRLFIATEVKLKDYNLVKSSLEPYINGRWSKEENLHITHKFIGDDDPNSWKIDLKPPDEKIKLNGFGIFGKKILYIKATSEHIDKIAKELNVKNFVPHVTICKMSSYKSELMEMLTKINIEQEIPFNLYLYSSALTPNGAVYKKLYRYKG